MNQSLNKINYLLFKQKKEIFLKNVKFDNRIK